MKVIEILKYNNTHNSTNQHQMPHTHMHRERERMLKCLTFACIVFMSSSSKHMKLGGMADMWSYDTRNWTIKSEVATRFNLRRQL